MAVLARIVVVIFAYLLACIAASIVFTIGILTPELDGSALFASRDDALGVVIALTALLFALLALLPALLVIVLSEGFALRSSLLYAALGCVVVLSVIYSLNATGYVGELNVSDGHTREVLAATGIAGGLVYWLFAGRRAGLWKQGGAKPQSARLFNSAAGSNRVQRTENE